MGCSRTERLSKDLSEPNGNVLSAVVDSPLQISGLDVVDLVAKGASFPTSVHTTKRKIWTEKCKITNLSKGSTLYSDMHYD